ncbi:hypothetical protein [Desulfobacter postgatei]|uniref:hypothetical protein n=1 Tax=Desulfobacter postgatei TaxID=2293 RepID=UPI002A367BB5|nr:hypothetical protein [Desulfobacter postgatei]MDX9965005.1 hypothetical protein [Desulfobacter postgatei]
MIKQKYAAVAPQMLALIIVAANFDYQIMISQRQKDGYDNIGCRFFTFRWIDGQNY